MVEEPGCEGATCKTFVPVCVIGARAEETAETFETGDTVLVEGTLRWRG
jgi:single-stranded DNA-binding protein